MPVPPAEFKTCTVCRVRKHRSEYSSKSSKKNVVSAQCRPCRAELAKSTRPRYPVNLATGTKTCNCCGLTKSAQLFGVHNGIRDGLSGKCKDCRNKTSRSVYLKSKYGISEREYEVQRILQDSKCWICLTELEDYGHIDHCHASGENRGILCENCNRMLGMARENTVTLERAIEYLKNGGCWNG